MDSGFNPSGVTKNIQRKTSLARSYPSPLKTDVATNDTDSLISPSPSPQEQFYCRFKGCPRSAAFQSNQANAPQGFSSKKHRARHEASHDPKIQCEWQESDGTRCPRFFSRTDNMKDHMYRIHIKKSQENGVGQGQKSGATSSGISPETSPFISNSTSSMFNTGSNVPITPPDLEYPPMSTTSLPENPILAADLKLSPMSSRSSGSGNAFDPLHPSTSNSLFEWPNEYQYLVDSLKDMTNPSGGTTSGSGPLTATQSLPAYPQDVFTFQDQAFQTSSFFSDPHNSEPTLSQSTPASAMTGGPGSAQTLPYILSPVFLMVADSTAGMPEYLRRAEPLLGSLKVSFTFSMDLLLRSIRSTPIVQQSRRRGSFLVLIEPNVSHQVINQMHTQLKMLVQNGDLSSTVSAKTHVLFFDWRMLSLLKNRMPMDHPYWSMSFQGCLAHLPCGPGVLDWAKIGKWTDVVKNVIL